MFEKDLTLEPLICASLLFCTRHQRLVSIMRKLPAERKNSLFICLKLFWEQKLFEYEIE